MNGGLGSFPAIFTWCKVCWDKIPDKRFWKVLSQFIEYSELASDTEERPTHLGHDSGFPVFKMLKGEEEEDGMADFLCLKCGYGCYIGDKFCPKCESEFIEKAKKTKHKICEYYKLECPQLDEYEQKLEDIRKFNLELKRQNPHNMVMVSTIFDCLDYILKSSEFTTDSEEVE